VFMLSLFTESAALCYSTPACVFFFYNASAYKELSPQFVLLELFFDQKFNAYLLCIVFLLLMLFFAQKIINNYSLYFIIFFNFSFFSLAYRVPTTIESTLWNGLSMIHPTFVFLAHFFFFFLVRLQSIPRCVNFIFFYKAIHKFFFLFTTAALLLGAWWAQEELNWGGWWSWDLVECSLLILFLISIRFLHSNFKIQLVFIHLFLFLFFFLGVRYGFFSSVHSFIGSNFRLSAAGFFLFLIFSIGLTRNFRLEFFFYEIGRTSMLASICFFGTSAGFCFIFAWLQCFAFSISPHTFFFFFKKKKFLHIFIFFFFFFFFFF
jgi:cytochrome c biogenesis factor